MVPLTPHPNPRKAARGAGIAVVGAPHITPPGPQETTRKGLIDELPEIREFAFGFSQIRTPTDAAFVLAHGIDAAWYRLGRLDRNILNQDCFLNKIVCTQLSADVTGTAAGQPAPPYTPVPWGSKLGRGAAIVITKGTPVDPVGSNENWLVRRLNMPGMRLDELTDFVTDDAQQDQTQALEDVICSFDWTIGQLADTQPYKQERSRSFGVFGKRIGRDDAIEVWFVVRPATITGTASAAIFGHCLVQLYVGLTRGSGDTRD